MRVRLRVIRIGVSLLCVLGSMLVFGSAFAGASTLPDNRAYELVSPPTNQDVYVPSSGYDKEVSTERLARASAAGGAVAYLGEPPAAGGNGSQGKGLGNQFLATRTPEGWTASDITPPASLISVHYEGFSGDLSEGVLTVTSGESALFGAAECDELLSYTSGDDVFHPFFTQQITTGCSEREAVYAGSSADGSHLLFQSGDVLTPEAKEASQNIYGHGFNLYDSVTGQLHLVNVLPNGETDADATFGSQAPSEEFRRPDFDNVVSADGSHVFWTDLSTEVTSENPTGTTRLFVRENDSRPQSPLGPHGECTVPEDACTVQLDSVQGGPGNSGGGRFLAASSDGSKVFFTDCSRLTAGSTAVSGGNGCVYEDEGEAVVTGNDLYEYDFNKPLGERLTDLTVDAKDPVGADVQGVVAINETGEAGSYIYFVAGGALAPGATPLLCQEAKLRSVITQAELEERYAEEEEEANGLLPAGRGCNLYVAHAGQPIRLIGTLTPRDDTFEGPADYETNGASRYGDWHADLGSRTAEATPDGRDLVFRSTLSLTGYENLGFPEVFVYDTDSGRLSCASCSPNGAPTAEKERIANSGDFGGFLPSSLSGVYMLRWISDDGSSVFFDTNEPLVAQDSNGRIDVYEWERGGAGSCHQETGCIYLLSGGTGPVDSYLLDTSTSGGDVFIASRERLVPEALDETVAVYDARVGGGFPRTSLACTGTGCQGVPPAPPIFATPSSATFAGVGNFESSPKTAVKPRSKPAKCRRGLVKKRGRCVRKKAKRSSKRSKRGRK